MEVRFFFFFYDLQFVGGFVLSQKEINALLS